MTCMSLCSSNSACLTFAFDNKYGLIYNCFIYNRNFLPSELINSSSSSICEIKTSIFNLSYLNSYHIFKKIVSLNACQTIKINLFLFKMLQIHFKRQQ